MIPRRVSGTFILLIAGAVLGVGFAGGVSEVPIIGYALLGIFYATLLGYHRYYDPEAVETTFLILVAAIIGQLLVIDPVEPGLYGRDSYRTLFVSQGFFETEIIQAIIETKAWPFFYALVDMLHTLLGVRIETLGKYLPLITSSAPVFVFLIARRLLPDLHTAFIVGLSTAVLKTFLLFETKFVDETIAVVLFFTAVAVIILGGGKTTEWRLLLIPFLVGIILSHPMTGMAFSVFAGASLMVGILPSSAPRLLNGAKRFLPQSTTVFQVSFPLLAVHVAIFTFVYLALAGEYVVGAVLLSAGAADSVADGAGSTGPALPALFTSLPLIATILILATILAWGFVSSYRMADWELSLAISCGVFTAYFGVTILMGRVIGFDQSRVLIYLIPFLFLVGASVLLHTSHINLPRANQTLTVIFAVFLVSQIMAIPTHVMYSDPMETVPDTDRNPTISEQAATSWGASAGYPMAGGGYDPLRFSQDHCPHPTLNRDDIPPDYGRYQHDLTAANTVYENGAITLASC